MTEDTVKVAMKCKCCLCCLNLGMLNPAWIPNCPKNRMSADGETENNKEEYK